MNKLKKHRKKQKNIHKTALSKHYNNLTSEERRSVRTQLFIKQDGCCAICGKPREKIYKTDYQITGKGNEKYDTNNQSGGLESGQCTPQSMKYGRANALRTEIGYTDCGCKLDGEKWRPGIVLDPFGGSGTVGVVAARLKRDYVLIELQPDYIKMAEERLKAVEIGVPVKEARAGQKALFE